MLIKIFKVTLKLALIAGLLALISIIAMPTLLSISSINQYAFSRLNRSIPGKVYAQELHVGWLDGVTIKGIEVKDSRGRAVADIEQIAYQKPLISLLYSPLDMGKLIVQKPALQLIDETGNGDYSLEKVFSDKEKGKSHKKKKETSSSDTTPTINIALDVQEGSITVIKPEDQKVVLSELNASIDIQEGELIDLSLFCKIRAKEEEGSVKIRAKAKELALLQESYLNIYHNNESSEVELEAEITNFPVYILKGEGVDAIGKTLSSSLHHTLKNGKMAFSVDITSDQLNGTLHSEKSGKLTWNIPKKLMHTQEDAKVVLELDPTTPKKLTGLINILMGKEEAKLALQADYSQAKSIDLQVQGSGEWPKLISYFTKASTDFIGKELEITGQAKLQDLKNIEATYSLTSDTFAHEAHVFVKDSRVLVTPTSTEVVLPTQNRKLLVDIESLEFPLSKTTLSSHAKNLSLRLNSTDQEETPLFDVQIPSIKASFDTKEKQFLGQVEGKDFSLDVDLLLQDELRSRKKEPLKARWTVTPERFQALSKLFRPEQKEAKLKLLSPVELTLSLTNLRAPFQSLFENDLSPTLSQILDPLECDFALSLSQMEYETIPQAKRLTIPPIKAFSSLEKGTRKLTFTLQSEKKRNASYIAVKGDANNLWNDTELNLSKATIKLNVNIQDFPLELLQNDDIVAVAGSTVHSELVADIDELRVGTLKGSITTPLLQSDIDVAIKQGTLFLNKPLEAKYTLTEAGGDVLLKGVNPLLTSGATSQSPITLLIDKADFQVPLKPFSLENVVINSLQIDPGILKVKKGGLLGMLLSLLKIDSSSNSEVQMQFTPIYMQMQDGVVTCKRADALVASAFPVATWGKIDLANDTIQMMLGLSGASLKRAFHLRNVDPEYLLQIPIRGSAKSPKIDTVMATAKITALKMQEKKSNGPAAILGGLLEVAASAVDGEEAPPPPTTYPFPWNKG